MGFQDSIRTCLSKYLTFSGRARRSEYWWFLLFVAIGGAILGMLDTMIFGAPMEPGDTQASPLATVFQLAMAIPLLAAGWRRLHDTGRPGWYLFIPMLISLAFVFSMLFGVMTFGAIEAGGADPDALRGPAAVLGLTGVMVAAVIQLIVAILMLYWLTRPSQPGENEYGPEPA